MSTQSRLVEPLVYMCFTCESWKFDRAIQITVSLVIFFCIFCSINNNNNNKIDILWGSPSHATVVFMGVLKIINISLKRGKYKIDIKRVNHINFNQLFQSWDLKSEKVVFVFILKLRLLNSFIKWYEDRFLPQLVLHDGSLNFSLPLVLYLW